MSDPLTDAANAISSASPKIRTFAQLSAQRTIALEARVAALTPIPPPPPPPPPPPAGTQIFTQHYDAASMQALLTAGDLVRIAADRITPLSDGIVKFFVKPGDVYSTWTGERAQIQLPTYQGGEGDSFNWQFDVTPAADWRDAYTGATNFWDAVLIFEFHHTASTGSPPFCLLAYHGSLVARLAPNGDPTQSNYWHETIICPWIPSTRLTVRVNAALSSDLAKSRTVVSAGGKTVTLGAGCNLLAGMHNYPEWGLYRAAQTFDQTATFGTMDRYA